MKRKFSSMWRGAMALVLVLSLGLVMAVPAAAEGETIVYGEYTFQNDTPATGVWSADKAHSGSYSALLTDGGTYPKAGRIIVGGEGTDAPLSLGIPLADITGLSFWFNYNNPGISPDYIPALSLHISTSGGTSQDFVAAVTMTAGDIKYGDVFEEDVWQEWSLDTVVTTSTPVGTSPIWHGDPAQGSTFAEWTAILLGAFPSAEVMHVMIGEGGWGTGTWTPSMAYVDDISIETTIDSVVSTTTYDLEPPIFLDDSYYQVDETVTVTAFDTGATGTISVYVSSGIHPLMGPVALTETIAANGMFVGSFTLVDTTPGPGDLLVGDADEVTVGYPDLESAEKTTAIVDNTLPVVAITSHEDGDFVTGNSVVIDWTIVDINEDTFSVTIDGSEVATSGTSHTWQTITDDVDDGAYTIEVVATDAAGLVGSASISVTVDNTDPVIVIAEQEATPPVVEPAVENTIVFTAAVTEANIDTVTIDLSALGGESDVEMLVDGDGYTANITATLTEAGSPYYLPITATDLAGSSVTTSGGDRLTLVCSSDTVSPVITDAAITYPFVGVDSAQPLDNVTIFATVIDDVGMGTVTAAATAFTTATIDLLDDGNTPDEEADDNIYTGTAEVKSDAGWGDYPITITATDAKGNEATDELTLAVRYGATGLTIGLAVGWNLISLPLIPTDADITVIISATTLASGNVSSVGTVRGYDPVAGDFPLYIPGTGGTLTEMEDGQGYWVFMEEADTLTITGLELPVPPAVPPTYDVVEGWNMIGFKSLTAMVDFDSEADSGYLLNIAGTYPVLWSYNATTGAYSNVKGLESGMLVGHGFWIWITETGTIVPTQ